MSFEKIILQCLMYCLVYLIGSNNCEDVIPVITVQAAHSWDYSQITNGSIIHHNKTLVTIPSSAKMCILSCSAPYPVTWIIHDQFRSSDAWTLGFRTKRTAVNIFDTTTFGYSADLSFYPHSENPWTGNYTCRSVAKEDLRASKFLFWEGTTPLLHAYKNLTVYVEDGMAVFPCMVSSLNIKRPTLQRKNGTEFRNLNLGPNLSYDYSTGFVLFHAENLTGQYKCIIDGQKDYINFDVKYYNETFAPVTKTSNASFKYDPVKKSLICCSSTKRSPKLMNYYCNHPSICDFKNLFTVPPAYPSFNRKSKKNCSKMRLYSYSAGVAHCLGDGIDMVKQYVFPMKYRYYWIPANESQPAYMQWNEIIPSEMIVMNFYYERPRRRYRDPYYTYKRHVTGPIIPDPMYDGDRVIFTCEPSTYYFAEGVRWSIKWKNQTLTIINSTSANTNINNNYYFHDSSSSTPITLRMDMESIICIAPVWNTSEYFFKPYHVYVNASKPTFLRGDNVLNESLTWTMNDTSKSIVCEAEGIPIPEFTWTKSTGDLHLPVEVNSANISSEMNNVTHVITETLIVHRVSYDTAGVYTCKALNSGGTVARVVTITVEEPSSWKKSVAITVGIVLFLALGAGLGLLYFKLRVDKKVIKQLTNTVGFANASNQEGDITDNDNSRYDAPKIHSNLLI